MKKAVIEGEGKAGLTDVADPVPRQDWVVVKVHTAPMCTEYKGFLGGYPSTTLGHEAAGEVVDVAQPGQVAVGDRVVVMPGYPCGICRLCLSGEYIHCEQMVDVSAFTEGGEGQATMAQYLLKPDWLLPKISDSISFDHGSLACCGLGPSFGALHRMEVTALDTVLITGLGPVGLGGVINAVYRGARVIAVDGQPWRAQRALDLGAEVVLAPDDTTLETIRDLTDGKGVHKALDCSGNVAAHRLCIDATRRRGQVAFVGECSDETSIRISSDMIRKGLTLVGSWHYNRRDAEAILRIIEERPTVMDQLISHTFPMTDVQQAFELQSTGDCAKVLLHPWETS
ncbi:MAG: zinc-binding dehydrogenase [Candidatus Latescibacterota bacterium]|nr:zinc-binding dehydrogenase [Candidatus Latescibacterota bacterium]